MKKVYILWRQTSDQYGTEEIVEIFEDFQVMFSWAIDNADKLKGERLRHEERKVIQ